MKYTFKATNIPEQQCKITASLTEENTFHVLFFAPNVTIPKGKVWTKFFGKVSTRCPNCNHELNMGNYELKPLYEYEYTGITVEIIPSYDENLTEFKIHYETVEGHDI